MGNDINLNFQAQIQSSPKSTLSSFIRDNAQSALITHQIMSSNKSKLKMINDQNSSRQNQFKISSQKISPNIKQNPHNNFLNLPILSPDRTVNILKYQESDQSKNYAYKHEERGKSLEMQNKQSINSMQNFTNQRLFKQFNQETQNSYNNKPNEINYNKLLMNSELKDENSGKTTNLSNNKIGSQMS